MASLESDDFPNEPCCCCSYNPFKDTSKESEIQDLSFALRKLTIMKCQMKKWRMERLQLESENRSLKQTLQTFGIDVWYFVSFPFPFPPLFLSFPSSFLSLSASTSRWLARNWLIGILYGYPFVRVSPRSLMN